MSVKQTISMWTRQSNSTKIVAFPEWTSLITIFFFTVFKLIKASK